MKYNYPETKAGRRRFGNSKTYRLTHWLQYTLWFIGIAWHNIYSNECTKDFNCCNDDLGRIVFLRIPE